MNCALRVEDRGEEKGSSVRSILLAPRPFYFELDETAADSASTGNHWKRGTVTYFGLRNR